MMTRKKRKASRPPEVQLSPAQQKFEECRLQIRGAPVARFVWERLLTADDRRLLGDDLDAAFAELGTVGMWMRVRSVGAVQAVLDVAQRYGVLSSADSDWMATDAGLSPPVVQIPRWEASTGQLTWEEALIRTVRLMKHPSNAQLLLDVFQEEGWPAAIDNPLAGARATSQLREAVRTLNGGLTQIRFHALQGGERCCWERSVRPLRNPLSSR